MQEDGQTDCPLNFKLIAKGKWSHQLIAEVGDLVRVIGKFCSENNYSLTVDDNEGD